MDIDLTQLFAPQSSLVALGPAQRRLIMALRQSVLHGKARSCPMRSIVPLLGGVGQANAFLKIVRVMGDIWPEPVRVMRPCSSRLSFDEDLLIALIDRAVHRDIGGFDAMLGDMIGRAERSRLFGEMLAFAAAFIGPAPRHAV